MAMQVVAEGQASWVREETVVPVGGVPKAHGPATGPETATPVPVVLVPMATQVVADGQVTVESDATVAGMVTWVHVSPAAAA
jgi:hypothetical protein